MSDTSDKGAKSHDEQPHQGDTGTERVLDADVLAAVEAAMNGHSGDAEVLPEQSPEALRVLELEAQLREVQLRAQAEVQNTQRRAERDVTNAHKFALEKFAGSLLEVVDNLERALLSVPADNASLKPLQEGLSMTHKLFADTLKRFAVESVDPLGAPFDPEQHQAVSMQPSTTAEPNTVTAVFQKGYTLSGRLLRPAMVVVATAG